MNPASSIKIGIMTCGGEELPQGTLARTAARLVLEKYRPEHTGNLCFPHFLSGDEKSRKFARENPVITLDGCEKICARKSALRYSGEPASSLMISELLKKWDEIPCLNRAELDERGRELAERIALEVSHKVDLLSQQLNLKG